MTETRKKLAETQYFFGLTQKLFKAGFRDFEYNLNAFIGSARNVTFVMQKEFTNVPGFNEWWASNSTQKDESMKKFVALRNVSVKEKSIGHNTFTLKHDFGPDGLHVVGKKGPTSVVSDPIRFDTPIPEHAYVTIKDDYGERRVKAKLIHDFSVVETYDHGTKQIKFDGFITEANDYLGKLEKVVDECEDKFGIQK
ncbi:hypothetical protein H0W80_05245 [Candidatus Saccharibacteria bacterium]|nr:hypothetical protein [Candidatus Saccharibacteria bacterium]